jgi:YfiH family protein
VECQARRAAAAENLDAAPEDILCVTRAQGFHRRFLRGEASGKMNRGLSAPHAVGDFSLGEDPMDEPIAVTRDRRGDPRDIGGVDTKADNVGHRIMILPRPGASFEWRETAFGPALVCQPLEEVARHLFTSRAWALGAADAHRRDEGWAELTSWFGSGASTIVRLKQVHGRSFIVADECGNRSSDPLAEADIVLSQVADRPVAVQAADCVPLLLADRRLRVVAAAHAGWRGLAQRVPGVTTEALVRTYGCHPRELVAAIGPSVGSCCYEVGPDVRSAFEAGGFSEDQLERWFLPAPAPTASNPSMPKLPLERRPGHWYFDGWTAAAEQLTAAGLSRSQIFCAQLCTASHAEVFCSYRRNGTHAGRIAGAIASAGAQPPQ